MPNRCAIGLAVLVSCLAPLALATEVTVDYTFARPTMSQVDVAGVVYDRISMPDAPNGGKAGQPSLPVGGAKILLPYGEEVVGVEVTGDKVLVGSGYRIVPVGKPFPLSVGPTEENIPTPNEAIYGSATAFPAQRFAQVGTYGFRGYEIAYLRLEPTEYVPATGELYYYPRLHVTVRTAATGRTNSLLRAGADDAQQAAKKVDNPAAVASYPVTRSGRNYDLLILTTSNLAEAFVPLQDAHNANGTPTQIQTIASGSTWQTIRSYIRDAYASDGIRYVLIGGDESALPSPKLYTDDGAGGYGVNMPSDFYFGCLDGEYDAGSWQDVDLIGEVYIGRATVDNTTEVGYFVNKTIAYINEQHEFLNVDLQAGEYLGFGGVSEYAYGSMQQLVDGGTFDGYSTVGIPSSQFTIHELYDGLGDPDWPTSAMVGEMNRGVHWINHLGHGNQTSGLKMGISDAQNLTNTNYFFIFSQACDCGEFDDYECLAEYFTAKSEHGAFAVIMNARYGWGEFSSTDGPSQRFHRWFWDGVFNEQAEEKYYYGAANQYSKEMNIPRLADDCTRYCFYELNLLGDPSVVIIGAERPLKIKLQSSLPEIVPPNETTTITVQVDPGDEAYVSDTAVMNYRVNGGAFQTAPLTWIEGETYQATLPATACDSTLEYYFSAVGTASGVINLPKFAPTDMFQAYVATYVSFLSDTFQTDLGWTVWNSPNLEEGGWERAVPRTIAPPHGQAPLADADGSGMCFVTDNGWSHDVSGGTTILTSPAFDFTNSTNPMIQYARWISCDDVVDHASQADYLSVQLSNDGGQNWQTAERVTALDGSWVAQEIRVRDYVSLTNRVQMRFSIGDEPNNSLTEAAVDAVVIYDLHCDSVALVGDLNCDGSVDVFDIDPFVLALTDRVAYSAAFPGCNYMLADINNDGVVNVFDIDPFVSVLVQD